MGDPIGHLDFRPECDWQPTGSPKCTLVAQVAVEWSCECVALVCGIHSLSIRQRKFARCPVHGPAAFVTKTPLEGA